MAGTTTRTTAFLGALILMLSAFAALGVGAAFASEHAPGHSDDPPGQAQDNGSENEGQPARGSISIDDVPFDEETSNEVKVGCDPFRVDFFGFAEQEDVPVTFTLWAPHEEQDQVYDTTVDLEDARGNDLSAQLYIGVFDDPLGDALLSYEPAHAEDYDYKLRVEVIVKQQGESGIVSKKSMLFIDCPELAVAAAGEVADEGPGGGDTDAEGVAEGDTDAEGAVAGDVEAADEDDAPTPVGAVGAGTGPISPASGSSLIILLVLLTVASAGAALAVRRRTVGS